MNRRSFLKTSILGAAAATIAPTTLMAAGSKKNKKKDMTIPELKISFQEGTAPRKTLEEKLDYMEEHGVKGFEPWGGGLAGRVNEFQQALRGRDIKISAICAGFSGFILAENPEEKKKFDTSMREIVAAAGELGSVGVIMVPAFNGQKPVMPHTAETRQFLVEQLAELGEFALKHGTSVILEPLNRREAFYLRQIADAAAICRDTKCAGVRCMGDFWHMSEETSDYGAFISGGEYLNHVHIASRRNRITPGEDGEADNYVDGFNALKHMNYQGYVSFECGTKGDKEEILPAALKLLRDQWYNG